MSRLSLCISKAFIYATVFVITGVAAALSATPKARDAAAGIAAASKNLS